MGDFMLTAEPFLGGYSKDFGTVELTEITDLSIGSLAMPLNGQPAFTKAIKTALGAPVPTSGMSHSPAPLTHLLRLSPDQFMALLPAATTPATIIKKIDAYNFIILILYPDYNKRIVFWIAVSKSANVF